MKRFLTTTAIVAAFAMPAFAQSNTEASGNQQSGMESSASSHEQMNAMGIMASNLIGKRLYMQASGDMNAGQSGDAMNSQGLAGDQSSDMADAGTDADSAAENNVEAAGEELADAAGEAGQAIENTAEDAGQALANAADQIGEEIADVPDSWEMVADIDDVVVTEDGSVRALIVDAGGFLGMGETERRVEISNVRFVQDSDDEAEYYVVFTGDRALFESQERYDPAAAEAAGERRASEDPTTREQIAEMEQQQQAESVDWASVTTEELLGAAVYGENDNWIGDLSELNLGTDGKIDGVIVDVGGFLGIGEKPVMLTMDEIDLQRIRGDEIRAYVSATEEELDGMEAWSGGEM